MTTAFHLFPVYKQVEVYFGNPAQNVLDLFALFRCSSLLFPSLFLEVEEEIRRKQFLWLACTINQINYSVCSSDEGAGEHLVQFKGVNSTRISLYCSLACFSLYPYLCIC